MRQVAASAPTAPHCSKGTSGALGIAGAFGVSFCFTPADLAGPDKLPAWARNAGVADSSVFRVKTWSVEAGDLDRTFSMTPKTDLLATGRAGVTTAERRSFSISR